MLRWPDVQSSTSSSSSSSSYFRYRPAGGLHQWASQAALEHTQATITHVGPANPRMPYWKSCCRCSQGDACALPPAYSGTFDVVLAANLLDRVPDPQRVLQQVRARVGAVGGGVECVVRSCTCGCLFWGLLRFVCACLSVLGFAALYVCVFEEEEEEEGSWPKQLVVLCLRFLAQLPSSHSLLV
jgi:hypothetical protein